jgi:hypothetical protein
MSWKYDKFSGIATDDTTGSSFSVRLDEFDEVIAEPINPPSSGYSDVETSVFREQAIKMIYCAQG